MSSFWVNMATLPRALGFTWFVRNTLTLDERSVTGWIRRAVGGTSIALWFTVAVAGRWIGFSA